MPIFAEPWFLAFNTQLTPRPVMTSQDLAKVGPDMGKIAEQYGKK
jgi:hypothetical protein